MGYVETLDNLPLMPKFGTASTNNLATAEADLQLLFNEVIKRFDCSILCGHRGKEEQDAAYPKYSQVKWPHSKHNFEPSQAVDAVPYPVDWDNTDRMYMFVGYVLATAQMMYDQGIIDHEIISGADWDGDTMTDDQKFIDLPHFQITTLHKKEKL